MAAPQGAPRHHRLSSLVLSVALVLAPSARAQAVVDVELTEEGELRQGGQRLSQPDFYQLAGRRDLLEQSERNVVARRWLLASAGAVLVAAVVVGSIILAMTPDLDKPYCNLTVANFDECQGYHLLYQRGGIITLASGAAAALLLGALGWWTKPDVLSLRDLAPLVDDYNRTHVIPAP